MRFFILVVVGLVVIAFVSAALAYVAVNGNVVADLDNATIGYSFLVSGPPSDYNYSVGYSFLISGPNLGDGIKNSMGYNCDIIINNNTTIPCFITTTTTTTTTAVPPPSGGGGGGGVWVPPPTTTTSTTASSGGGGWGLPLPSFEWPSISVSIEDNRLAIIALLFVAAILLMMDGGGKKKRR